jgi:cytidyltransferase-like protein
MRKLMVFGTFDILHKGHLSFFKQAKGLTDHLIVVVARDKYVKEAKGRLPINNESKRVRTVRGIDLVDNAILGSRIYNFYRTIKTHKPDFIALGYDQKPTVTELKKNLRRHRLGNLKVLRLKPYKPDTNKTSMLLRK